MKTILITGAGKGIGRALASELCDRAAKSGEKLRLFLVSRTQPDLDSIKAYAASRGVEAEVLSTDLGTAKGAQAAFDACLAKFGSIDCLVNNAGVGRFGKVTELTEEDLDYVMDTNVRGFFLLTQKTYAYMESRRSGHLVFVTSTAAEKAFEQSALYCMSKFAQKGLIEVLRLSARKSGIRITHVMPGPVITPMWGEISDAQKKLMMPVEHVARAMADAILMPEPTLIEEIVIRPVTGDLGD